MSKVRVLYNPNKTVSIIHPVSKSRRKDETEEVWLKRVFDKATPKGATYDDIDASELPDRTDRMAWEGAPGNGITVNAAKAQKIRDQKLYEVEIARKIAAQQRANAITELKAKGKLPADFTDGKPDAD